MTQRKFGRKRTLFANSDFEYSTNVVRDVSFIVVVTVFEMQDVYFNFYSSGILFLWFGHGHTDFFWE